MQELTPGEQKQIVALSDNELYVRIFDLIARSANDA